LWAVIMQPGAVDEEAGRRPKVRADYLYYKLFGTSSVVIGLQVGRCRG